ncbi:hypothetical protein GW17_00057007 [Ensete ventricosum]|nr:hypothetical protein GW17_00057007 [Ensete ventricosum]RZS09098.1 hypothetical protein BHM03_00040139 [Ensete ventricosum]
MGVSSSASVGKRRESSREVRRVSNVRLEMLLLECASRYALVRWLSLCCRGNQVRALPPRPGLTPVGSWDLGAIMDCELGMGLGELGRPIICPIIISPQKGSSRDVASAKGKTQAYKVSPSENCCEI